MVLFALTRERGKPMQWRALTPTQLLYPHQGESICSSAAIRTDGLPQCGPVNEP